MNTTVRITITALAVVLRAFPNMRARLIVLISVCAWLGFSGIVSGQIAPPADRGEHDYAPGELVIKFKDTATEAQLVHAFQDAGLEKVLKAFKFKNRNQPSLHLVSTRFNVQAALRMLANHPAIEYAEPNYRIYTTTVPNDAQFSSLWGMQNTGQSGGCADADIDAPEAWNLTTGSSSVLIGVLDTGIDSNHPDLAANIWTNPGEIPNDGIDNDNNGYVDDVRGWDFWNGDNTVYDPADGDSHGTHVAGTIAAVGNNGIGVTGVNWQAKILPLKFIGPQFGYNSGAILALEYAAAKGVKVINASFGGGYFGQGIKDAIEESGILFVAAAGNNSANNDTTPFYPAGFDLGNVIAVAATDHNDLLASFSNYGATAVDLGAPGANIFSTLPGNQYGNMNGTSMAAPHVTGVAGLVYSLFPNLTAAEVKYKILSAVDSIPALSGRTVTGGRLNAAKAVGPATPSGLIAYDGFESGNYTGGSGAWAGGWTASGDISILTSSGPQEGSRHVRLRRGTGYLRRAANVAGVTDIRLGFWAKVNSFEGSDRADVLVSTDGVNFTVIDQFIAADSDNLYHYYEIDLTSRLPASQLHVAFDAAMSANDDNWYLDDIRLTGTVGNLPPVADAGDNRTITDSDANGSEMVTLNGANSFDPDGTIVSYEWTEAGNLLGTTPTLDVDSAVGTWTATLTVTDNEGAARSDTVQVTVNTAPVEVFNDNFERTSLSPWTQDSQNDWYSSTQRSTPNGTRSAEVDGAATDAQLISPVINLQGRILATITFDWLIESGLDTGEYIACDVSQNGGSTWTELRRLSGNVDAENVWHSVTIDGASAPAGTVRLRFRGTMNAADEDANVDNVRVVAH